MKLTSKKERLRLYEEQASKLRLASICMNDTLAIETVQSILDLHRRFENEDDPHHGN